MLIYMVSLTKTSLYSVSFHYVEIPFLTSFLPYFCVTGVYSAIVWNYVTILEIYQLHGLMKWLISHEHLLHNHEDLHSDHHPDNSQASCKSLYLQLEWIGNPILASCTQTHTHTHSCTLTHKKIIFKLCVRV